MTTEALLRKLIEVDKFNKAPPMVAGIAQRAIDFGYNQLSKKQQEVLTPFLSEQCSGSTDPGGYHNGCQAILIEADLLEAYDLADNSDCIQCESCRQDDGYYAHQWEKIKRE